MNIWQKIATNILAVLLISSVVLISGCKCPCADEDYSQREENVLQYTGDLPEDSQ